MKCARYSFVLFTTLFAWVMFCFAQPNSSIDLYKLKPAKYKNRLLLSEKTGEGKIRPVKRLFQNTFTHYNYHFNANNKVNEILEKAKKLNKDDYTQLLPFYNYTLDNTALDKEQIDSVIYKCTAAILLHDLRDDWVDNMYMLMGRTYLYKKFLDSAGYVFQYINYAWAAKVDGYDLPIGSNISNPNGVFSISTPEKKSRLARIFNNPISRNESFLWRIRVLLEQNRMADANGLIGLLRIDQMFPKRLMPFFHEVMALSYYKQQVNDSAAWHLTRALPQAADIGEKARWEFLIAQLYGMTKNNDSLARHFYEKSIQDATDPLMEAFARLDMVSLSSTKKGYTPQDNIDEVYRLARKERFYNYRDVLYYAAALLELKQKNTNGGISALQKSLKYNSDNPEQRQKTLLLLADTYFDTKVYKPSYNYYDSVQTNTLNETDKRRVEERKSALAVITENFTTLETQDSLQRIAKMSEAERNIYIKKLLKKLRKAEGLKESDVVDFGSEGSSFEGSAGSAAQPTELFSANSKNDFYFNNTNVKQVGFTEWKSKWGNRPNVDNWRRQSAVTKTSAPKSPPPSTPDASPSDMNLQVGNDIDPIPNSIIPPNRNSAPKSEEPKDLSFEGFMRDVPLREDQMAESDSAIAKALFSNGLVFQNNLRDFQSAVNHYEPFLHKFPKNEKVEQGIYNLIYCYRQLGLTMRADSITKVLRTQFPNGKYTALLDAKPKLPGEQDDTTVAYQHVYNTFVKGNFENAKVAKAEADKKYGKSYWTPQLLFIESVYYIKANDDSTAIDRLESLVNTFPNTPLTEKAIRMIELLRERGWRAKRLRDSLEARTRDSIAAIDSLAHLKPLKDTITKGKDTLIKKVNPVIKPSKPTIPPAQPVLKPAIDTTQKVPKKDSVVAKEQDTFMYDPLEPHYAILQLDDVDNVFINRAANSFDIYNKSTYPSRQIDIASEKINDQYAFLYLGPLENAADAMAYLDKAKKSMRTTIIPWLPSYKFKLSIISGSNLLVLQKTKDVVQYNKFLKKVLPGKF